MGIFKLDSPPSDWGDYGAILLSGMVAHLPRENGRLQLERTGPFVPPISFSSLGDIVVTDSFKRLLEDSGLTGFMFLPVVKKHIVLLEWEKWDKASGEPAEYPSTGEPEDCILERPHSPKLAQQIGTLWELCLEEFAGSEEASTDWYRLNDRLYNFVSARAKHWLEQTVPEYVSLTTGE
jgi:hypothetical protein